jgi:Outer membrane protein beta-barrel domain
MRTILAFMAAAALSVVTAYGQEAGVGAGRIEIGGFPVGGMAFGHGSQTDGPNFRNYALGATFAFNVNKWIGFEGEIGGGVGIRHDMTFAGLRLEDQKSPNMLAYNGDLVVHVVGSDRAIAPYVVSGVGGLTLFTKREVTNLGILNNETYFTGNVGGGVKWFATQHVGLRGDGRFIMVKSRDEVPFFSQEKNQYGARLYAGVLLTY